MNAEDGLTILIDFDKYHQLHPINVTISSNSTAATACADLDNGVYQVCGKKCILSCRYNPAILDVAQTSNDCPNTECIEGCFCKVGFVRYRDKCILPKECPQRSNKSIEFNTDMPNNALGKRISKPNCAGSNGSSSSGCVPPCIPFLCHGSANQNLGRKNMIFIDVPRFGVILVEREEKIQFTEISICLHRSWLR